MLRITIIAATGLLMAACTPTTTAEMDPLAAAVSGRTLVTDTAQIEINADGSISGTVGSGSVPIAGAWTVRDGQWCRTLTAPENLAGTLCQDASVSDDGSTFTVEGRNGPQTFTIQ